MERWSGHGRTGTFRSRDAELIAAVLLEVGRWDERVIDTEECEDPLADLDPVRVEIFRQKHKHLLTIEALLPSREMRGIEPGIAMGGGKETIGRRACAIVSDGIGEFKRFQTGSGPHLPARYGPLHRVAQDRDDPGIRVGRHDPGRD